MHTFCSSESLCLQVSSYVVKLVRGQVDVSVVVGEGEWSSHSSELMFN